MLNVSKIWVQNMWTWFYQDKIMIIKNDVSQYESYIHFDKKDDYFYRLLNTHILQADPNVKVVVEYVKYITKD